MDHTSNTTEATKMTLQRDSSLPWLSGSNNNNSNVPSLLEQDNLPRSSPSSSIPRDDTSPKLLSNHNVQNLNFDDVTAPPSDANLDAMDINKDFRSEQTKELLQSRSCQKNIRMSAMTENERSRGSNGELGSSCLASEEATARKPLHESSQKQRLTLSAYRRPEETIRIADQDVSRIFSDLYDLDNRCSGILGHGAISTVRLATRRSDGVKVAVKSIPKHDVLRSRRLRQSKNRRYLDEWEILNLLGDNQNVVSLLDVFETDEEVQLILEYCSGGELYDAIQKHQDTGATPAQREEQAARIASQMLSALDDLHSRGIVHRDVKPENILLSDSKDPDVKLCDFGLARLLVEDSDSDSASSDGESSPLTPGRRRAYSTVGSSLYAAPEVSAPEGYGTAVDMYSLGVTLYVFLCGSPPTFVGYEGDGDVTVAFPPTPWKDISENAKNLIQQMLCPIPDKRITAHDALKHRWIVDHVSPGKPVVRQPHRSAHVFSPTKPRPVVDLELVKTRLCRSMDEAASSERRKRSRKWNSSRSKRRRVSQKDDLLMAAAMEDLYKGVASAADSATAAAAGVLCGDTKDSVQVLDEEDSDTSSNFCPPVTLLV